MRIPLFKANKSFTEYEKCCIENLDQLSCMISAELHLRCQPIERLAHGWARARSDVFFALRVKRREGFVGAGERVDLRAILLQLSPRECPHRDTLG